jgi:hypothetical protein
MKNYLILILALFVAACQTHPDLISLLQERKIPKEAIQNLAMHGRTDGSKPREPISRLYGELESWSYIGTIEPFHLIHCNIEGDTWRNSSIYVVKVVDDGLQVVETLDGLRHCEVLEGSIVGDTLQYHRMTTGYGFFFRLLELFPHLQSREISGQLKAEYGISIGHITCEAKFGAEGQIVSKKTLSFTPLEGWPPFSGKTYEGNELEALFLQLQSDE